MPEKYIPFIFWMTYLSRAYYIVAEEDKTTIIFSLVSLKISYELCLFLFVIFQII